MAENRRASDRGLFYFSRGQLGILAVGFTFTSAIIFFLGIYVGKEIEERKLRGKEEPIAKVPIRPPTRGSSFATGAPVEEEMTFYDTLTQNSPSVGASAPVKGKGNRPGEKAPKAKDAMAKLSPEGKTPPLSKKAKRRSVPRIQREGPVWSVQIKAFKRQKDAISLTNKLKSKGYDAYVVSTKKNGPRWYRVRVGRMDNQGQARRMLETLQKKEKYTKAIIARSR
ncbi:MAG: SPOR domain-containing protein [Deltaproteobacteria bacterium]|nr:SPOR domain-containing protein [Deltaproteobacteria bacterium]MCZ6452014.1 SPOR domain-containing protein [Deltaproteobacteria bacterium]